MLIAQILIQCLFGVLWIHCFEPFEEYLGNPPGSIINPIGDLDFNVPKWVLVPPNRQPTCRLTAVDNWENELHPDIVGNGSARRPMGAKAFSPRYYVKKIQWQNYFIQVFALLDPLANLDPGSNPMGYHNQLWSMVCRRGIVEFPPYGARQVDPGMNPDGSGCGVEETLIKICLQDQTVGQMQDRGVIFHQLPGLPAPNYEQRQNIENMKYLVSFNSCRRFFIIWLPTRRDLGQPWQRTTPIQSSSMMKWYLTVAHSLNFDRVVLYGQGLGPQGCGPLDIAWAGFPLEVVLQDDILRDSLIMATTVNHLPHEWYFCKTLA